MRATTLLSAALAAAVMGSLAFAPKAAQAHGAMVAALPSVSAGTIVVRTNERRLYYVLGRRASDRLSGRRRPRRQAVVGHLLHQRQVHPSGLGAAVRRARRSSKSAESHQGRLAAQPDGRRGDVAAPAANTPSTAPTSRARSATSCPTAASACSTRTSGTSTGGSASEPRSSSSKRPAARNAVVRS